jgi:hypothetical protein
MSIQAFMPFGNTHAIAVTAVASTPEQITGSPGPITAYQFVNSGSNPCWVVMDPKGVNAVIPAPGSPANGIPILPNEIVLYRGPADMFVSAICGGGLSTTLYVTPGEGM